jgi:hypothetical protein
MLLSTEPFCHEERYMALAELIHDLKPKCTTSWSEVLTKTLTAMPSKTTTPPPTTTTERMKPITTKKNKNKK